ncbi:hypothetical protein PV325_012487 [Microctonus aethiopoides]|uniref:Uncharacterized protein n=1 Tax=Microctonus aethiopoides TaxID=144406 RepID=A0AA39C873_9HYME|nr:hypothetical protein PV325_012487 [Microctonus aethiopoides]KAK0094154.1 hypothetical protein PV326_011711 [Microctonus aethiopoides]KAK0159379.1 hypothetical protein PV328_010262 [Microctonus aethiopoides]
MSTLAQLSTDVRLDLSDVDTQLESHQNQIHSRSKRTLFLKKKLIGAGLLGFGLGVAKGFKVGYQHSPEVQHVYVAAPPPPPPAKYIEYVEKPIYIERFVERPPIAKQEHGGYDGAWSPPPREPSPVYGY